ncbi:MAG: hypothetical protein M3Z16_10670, partial [Pseudomonadota bacterium]|nr:hypothetical protein [Pseudomonadota bacterium]
MAVIDRASIAALPISLPKYFPETFVDRTPAEIEAEGLPLWDTGNLWLSATNGFAVDRRPGRFESLPGVVTELLAAIGRLASTRPRVLVHVLDDATNLFRKNWKRIDAERLCARLTRAGCDVVVLNPARGIFLGDFDRMLAEMLAADLFIGGDTGPSHVFALLRGGAPQIAIVPDMARDRATYAPEQARLNLPLPWCSLPLQINLDVVQLVKRKRLVHEATGWRLQSVGRFDPARVAALALA